MVDDNSFAVRSRVHACGGGWGWLCVHVFCFFQLYRAADMTKQMWTGRMRVVQRGLEAAVMLVDR